MTTKSNTVITIETIIDAPVEKVWDYWTGPDHITQWNQASDDWHTPWAKKDIRVGGEFSARMEAKDGSFGFEFSGIYDEVKPHQYLGYTMGDGRKVHVDFKKENNQTRVVERFDAEQTNPVEMQQAGWQAILDCFKRYTESH
jgi:uncharacterized protein YndB with AHSA1/START domain